MKIGRSLCAVLGGVLAGVMLMTVAHAAVPEVTVGPVSAQVYGSIRLSMAYDTHKVAGGSDGLAYYVLPLEAGEEDNEFAMTANETRFGINVNGPEAGFFKTTTGKIEADFYGKGGAANGQHIRLRHAWMDLASENGFAIRAGQDWDTFILVDPMVVNFASMSDQGHLGNRRPQLRLSQDVKAGEGTKLTVAGAIARIAANDLDAGAQDDGTDSGIPGFQAKMALSSPLLVNDPKKPAMIGVSGFWGRENVDTVVSNKIIGSDEKKYDSYAVIVAGKLPITAWMALQGEVWSGQNLGNYYGGIGQGINLIKDTGIKATGGFAQLCFAPAEKVDCSLFYGIDTPKDDDLNDGQRSRNQNVGGNASYKISSAVKVAFEYCHLTTRYKAGDDVKDNRFGLTGYYNF